MSIPGSKTLSFETILDKLGADFEDASCCPTEEKLIEMIEELCLENAYLVERAYDDDSVIYEARPGLKWQDFVDLDDPVKKQILLYLVDNPKVFFVLYGTQKGKSRISAKEMLEWSKAPDVKVVGVVIVDNDKTLADQSADGFKRVLSEVGKVFTLSSNSSVKIEEVVSYIDAYGTDVYGDYKMPIIVALQNAAQIKLVVQLLTRIQTKANHPTHPSKLRYGILPDEADKTYPPIRNRLLPFISDSVALHRIGFVTATDGGLLNLEDYPECCNAQLYQADSDSPNYRGIHTDDAVIHRTELTSKRQKPNDYAEMVISNNRAHFTNSIVLDSGEQYFRKIIVNGNTSVRDMATFARARVAEGFYALTFNQSGICAYRPDSSVKRYKMKGRRLNEMIMFVYKSLRLNDRPLVIVGRRKVDRGLGFHYAPQTTDAIEIEVESEKIVVENGEGIIFTDMILGHVEDKNTAVQKSGRLAGIVAHCPQYSGELHFWTDERTARIVVNHNRMVDVANTLPGAYSTLQATIRAKDQVSEIVAPDAPIANKYSISEQSFNTKDEAYIWCTDNCHYDIPKKRDGTMKTYGKSAFGLYKLDENGNAVPCSAEQSTHIKYRGDARLIQSEVDTRNSMDLGWGVESSARIMPVKTENNRIKYIVIYKPK